MPEQPPPQSISYRAGLYTWSVRYDEHVLEYGCPPFLKGRIRLEAIVGLGISDDRHMDAISGGDAFWRLAGIKDGLGGLMIAYRVPRRRRPKLSTIAFDFGDDASRAFLLGFLKRFPDRFLGIAPRGELATQMGVKRTFETVVAAGVIGAIVLITGLIQFC